jgi:hypothetical protein
LEIYTFFAQNFLLPALAGLICLILGASKKWPLGRTVALTFVVVVAAFVVSWSVMPQIALYVSGSVLDESNHPLDQAVVKEQGGSEQCPSQGNGSFRLEFKRRAHNPEIVRIHATKDGYYPFDGMAQAPSDDFLIHLYRTAAPELSQVIPHAMTALWAGRLYNAASPGWTDVKFRLQSDGKIDYDDDPSYLEGTEHYRINQSQVRSGTITFAVGVPEKGHLVGHRCDLKLTSDGLGLDVVIFNLPESAGPYLLTKTDTPLRKLSD